MKCTNMPASFPVKFSIHKAFIPPNAIHRFNFLTSHIPLRIDSDCQELISHHKLNE